MFLELYLGQCGFGGRPETKSICTSSSGRCFLILSGCWLLAFCMSWKKLGKADVWVHYFSSLVCVWFTAWWSSLSGTYESRFFFQPQRHTKTSLMVQMCFSGRQHCWVITFVSPVQMSHVIIWLWGFIWWWLEAMFYIPQYRRSSSLFCRFQTPVVKNTKRQMLFICVWRTVVVSWTWCDFAGPFVWLSGPLRPKVFPPVGFQRTWCFGTHKILKKLFVISR